MYISEDQVEQERKSCDIVARAGRITRLRKKKNSLWGKCPFCNDKGKHFGVKEDKQIFCSGFFAVDKGAEMSGNSID